MSSAWDTLKVSPFAKGDWKSGNGFSKPGIGGVPIPWPSLGQRFGGANPTCGECGKRLRGDHVCECEEPVWFIDGEPVEDNYTVTQMQDNQEWHRQWLAEAFKVLPSGGIAKVFSATRTYHRLAAAMEQVGFVDLKIEGWGQGQGFPKSLNVSKAIDKLMGKSDDREVVGYADGVAVEDNQGFGGIGRGAVGIEQHHALIPVTVGATPEAKQFEGYGTALKPSWEPFVVGRKP